MAASKAAERRKQVVLDLSPDFLRIPGASQPPAATQYPGGVAVVPASAFIPPNTRGRLSVTIVQGKLAKNYGFVRMDPYGRLRVGNAIFETPTDHNGAKMPRWNRTIHCYLPNGVDSVYLEIFDERALSMDERIAWGHVMIPEAVFNGEVIDDWYCLSGQQGEGKEGMVNLVLSLSPVDAPPVAYIPSHQPTVLVQQSGIPAAAAVAQQPQPPIGPLWTDEDVKELNEMFPQFESTVIQSILDEKRGNKDATINALLTITADESTPPTEDNGSAGSGVAAAGGQAGPDEGSKDAKSPNAVKT